PGPRADAGGRAAAGPRVPSIAQPAGRPRAAPAGAAEARRVHQRGGRRAPRLRPDYGAADAQVDPAELAAGDGGMRPAVPDPLEVAQRLNAVCRRFERAWRDGRRPVLAAYLDEVSSEEQPGLFRELLALEVELRTDAGQPPTAEEYLACFPEF